VSEADRVVVMPPHKRPTRSDAFTAMATSDYRSFGLPPIVEMPCTPSGLPLIWAPLLRSATLARSLPIACGSCPAPNDGHQWASGHHAEPPPVSGTHDRLTLGRVAQLPGCPVVARRRDESLELLSWPDQRELDRLVDEGS